MKKSISLVLCLAMLVSMFSCFGITASAAGDAKEIFSVKTSGFKNNKAIYTVYLNKGFKMSGSIIYVKFDPDVIEIDEENTGAYMVDDGDGGERENIGGIYEKGFMTDYKNNDHYSIGHVYSPYDDYKSGSSNKAYMKFTFKAIDKNRPATNIEFYCYQFNSESESANNIEYGSAQKIYSKKVATLGKVEIKEAVSTKDGVEISWKKVTGADFYRVYKKVNGEFEIINETTSGSVTSYLDTDVVKNKSYTYAVRAVNEASAEDEYGKKYPATLSDSSTTRYTVAPTTLKLSNDDGKVVVKWSEVDGATAYRVYRRTVKEDGTTTSWKSLGDKTTDLKYSDKTAKSGTRYQYAVRVYSDGGYSALYSEKEILYLGVPRFTVEASVKGVLINWDDVTGATNYKVYRKVKGGSWKTIKTLSSKTTYYTDTAATSGKYIYYAVKAVNDSYISDYDTHALTYLKTPVASVKNTSSGVRISWDKVGGATSYEIYRKAGSAKSWSKVGTTKKDAYTDKTVKSGTTYKYTVRAISSSVKSKYGSTAYETIKYLSAPVLGKIKSTKSGITVYWDEVSGASGYIVYRKTGSGSYEEYATVKGKSTVKYLDKSAEKGKTYSYRVYAYNGSYKSSYKSSVSIKDKY